MDRLQQARGAARISTRLHQPRSRGSQPRGTTPGRGAGWLQSGGAGSPRSCRTPCSQNLRSYPSQHHCRGASPLRSRSSPCQSSRNNCAHQRVDERGGIRALRRRSVREQRAARRRNSGTKMVHKLGQTLAAIERELDRVWRLAGARAPAGVAGAATTVICLPRLVAALAAAPRARARGATAARRRCRLGTRPRGAPPRRLHGRLGARVELSERLAIHCRVPDHGTATPCHRWLALLLGAHRHARSS